MPKVKEIENLKTNLLFEENSDDEEHVLGLRKEMHEKLAKRLMRFGRFGNQDHDDIDRIVPKEPKKKNALKDPKTKLGVIDTDYADEDKKGKKDKPDKKAKDKNADADADAGTKGAEKKGTRPKSEHHVRIAQNVPFIQKYFEGDVPHKYIFGAASTMSAIQANDVNLAKIDAMCIAIHKANKRNGKIIFDVTDIMNKNK